MENTSFVVWEGVFVTPSISGYDWCVDAIKNSEYARLAGDLEVNKAVMFLKQGQLTEAIETLKNLDKETTMATSAAINLSFIYYLVTYPSSNNDLKIIPLLIKKLECTLHLELFYSKVTSKTPKSTRIS